MAMIALPSVSCTCGKARNTVPMSSPFQLKLASANVGRRGATVTAASSPASSGLSPRRTGPEHEEQNTAGARRFGSNSSVPARPIPPIAQLSAIILAPLSMKPRPKPRMMPTTTGRPMYLVTFCAVPLRPSSNQTTPVTRLAANTAPAVTVSVCAAGSVRWRRRPSRLHRQWRPKTRPATTLPSRT